MTNMKNPPQNQWVFLWKVDFFYPIIVITIHKQLFLIFSYLTFCFQHIKHNWNDLDGMNSSIKHPYSEYNTKMHLLVL